MKSKIYISCPKVVDTNKLVDIKYKGIVDKAPLGKWSPSNDQVTYWGRGLYDSSLLNNCDKFILVHPKFKWQFNINELPSGVLKEFNIAKKLGKKMYLFYETNSGEYNFYEFKQYGDVIEGVAGTSHKIFEGEWDEIGKVDEGFSNIDSLEDLRPEKEYPLSPSEAWEKSSPSKIQLDNGSIVTIMSLEQYDKRRKLLLLSK